MAQKIKPSDYGKIKPYTKIIVKTKIDAVFNEKGWTFIGFFVRVENDGTFLFSTALDTRGNFVRGKRVAIASSQIEYVHILIE
jgi:hypothetical protein